MRIGRRGILGGTAGCTLLPSLLPRAAHSQAPAAPGPLHTKPIPSSGERIPVIGLGTARRYESASTDADLAPLRDTVQALRDGGATVIDTAPSYGNAEAVVGRLTEELRIRPAVFLATKVAATGQDAAQREIQNSFKALRTDRIDLIAVHNLRDVDGNLRILRGLKDLGRIRYVGVTTSFESQHDALADLMAKERLDFIQVDYALDNRGADRRILPLALDRGIAVMLNLPFGRGRLFQAVQGKPLPDWAKEIGCTSWAQVFLKYLVSHEAVTCAAPGMARPEYVRDNLQAAKGPMPDAAARRRMETFIDAL